MGFLSKLFKKCSAFSSSAAAYNSKNVLQDRLETIIADEFSEYELRTEIPASDIGACRGARDYSYGLYLNGSPKALIMIMDDRNTYKKKEVVLARQAAESKGIPYMNFMPHLPNDPEYISNRLKQNVLK